MSVSLDTYKKSCNSPSETNFAEWGGVNLPHWEAVSADRWLSPTGPGGKAVPRDSIPPPPQPLRGLGGGRGRIARSMPLHPSLARHCVARHGVVVPGEGLWDPSPPHLL